MKDIFNNFFSSDTRISKNVAFGFFDKLVRAVFGLVVTVILANLLTSSEFGSYSMFLLMIGVGSQISNVGLLSVVPGLISKGEAENSVLSGAFIINLIGAVITGVAVAGYLSVIGSELSTGVVAAIVGIFFFKTSEIIKHYYEGKIQVGRYVNIELPIFILFASVRVALALGGVDLELILYTYFFEFLLISISLTKRLKSDLSSSHRNGFPRLGLPLVWSKVKYMMPSGIIIALYMKMDQILIPIIINSEALGLYSIMYRLVEFAMMLLLAMSATLLPQLNETSDDRRLFDNILIKAIRVGLAFTIFLTISSVFLGDFFLGLVFGERFSENSEILVLLSFGLIFFSMGLFGSRAMIADGMEKSLLIRSALSLLSSCFFNYWFITNFGLIGAAYAFLCTQFVFGFLFDAVFLETRPLFKTKIKALFGWL